MSLDLSREIARRRAGVAALVRDLDAEAVPPEQVPAAVRQAAERALAAASRELGIAPPRLLWLPAALVAGVCDGWTPATDGGDRIYIRADLDPERAAFVARHEARHAWQRLTGRFLGPDQREQDANRFAHQR